MTSPVSASSSARLRPTLRATATSGVWQNRPPLPPGMAKPASSAATARSHVATSWQPAAVASACTLAHDRLRDGLDGVHHLGAHLEQPPGLGQVGADHVAEVVPGGEHRAVGGEDHAEGVAVAAARKAAVSSSITSSDSALRFSGRLRVIVEVALVLDEEVLVRHAPSVGRG